jgi:hypothetical protein
MCCNVPWVLILCHVQDRLNVRSNIYPLRENRLLFRMSIGPGVFLREMRSGNLVGGCIVASCQMTYVKALELRVNAGAPRHHFFPSIQPRTTK